jgi:N-acyl homoserine lactone hydrolase
MYCFLGGYEIADKSMLTLGRGLGVNCKIPFQYFLIEHPKGRLLFDTGFNPAFFLKTESYPPGEKFSSQVVEEDLAINRLSKLGIKPEQIDLVANSHLHYDHAGGNSCFSSSTFLVQFNEIQSAMWPEPYSGLVADNYFRKDFDLNVKFEQLDGDYDVFNDGSVQLISTPGHTRGHQSLFIRLPEFGPIVLTQDAVYLMENLEDLVLAPTCWNQKMMYESFQKIKKIQSKEGAFVVPGHDFEVIQKMKLSPEYYS